MLLLFSLLFSLLSLLPFTLSVPTSSQDCSYSAPGPHYFYLSNITYASHFIYSTPAHLASSSATLSFDFYNSAVPYTVHCSAGSIADPYQWFIGKETYQCTMPEGAGKYARASFKYNGRDNGELSVNQTWFCEGARFLGSTTGSLKLDCKTEDVTAENFTWPDSRLYRTVDTKCQPGTMLLVPTLGKDYCTQGSGC
ncbi:hypothetical protein BCR34DRAFT_602949 [Clohesyomyces aquaticus]|uniref:AA1-like domain-containing protein n=1 Tax=Clohesyomyces aquaticus TaxID=1231657 RepID=A0A1Y1ZGD0_9PLEO|nr:hypothetical protein BCR34DRAFT_602949 [Clohesyomyces aquaticus]